MSGRDATQRRQLETYLQWNLVVATVASLVQAVLIAVALRSVWAIVLLGLTLVACGTLVVARRLAAAGHPERAVLVLAVLDWTSSVVTVWVVPDTLPTMVMVSLMPVVVAVPHLSPRAMRALGAGAVAAVTAIALVGRLHGGTGLDALVPPAVMDGMVIVFAPLVAGLIGLLAWLNHRDLAGSARDLQEAQTRVVAAGDRARRQIERDLHDGPQQRLLAISMQVALLRTLQRTDPARAGQLVESVGGHLREAIDELRALAGGVYPPLLAEVGLAAATRTAAGRLGRPVDVDIPANRQERHPPDVEASVYFCCLEALTNAVKHAGPEAAVRIRLYTSPDIWFEVADTGLGIDAGGDGVVGGVGSGDGLGNRDGVGNGRGGGQGLVNMRDRLGALGGTLEILAVPGGGTVVRGRVPRR